MKDALNCVLNNLKNEFNETGNGGTTNNSSNLFIFQNSKYKHNYISSQVIIHQEINSFS